MPAPHRPHTRWPFVLLFGVLGALIVGVVVLAFVWPAATLDPRGLRVGLSGPTAQVSALKTAVAKQTTQPFDFVDIDSRADAVTEIRSRRLYGAILLGDSPEVLTSSAASTASNQALRGVATSLQSRISAGVESGLISQLQQAGKAVAALEAQLRTGARPTGGASTGGSGPSGAPSSGTASIPTVKVTDVVALSSSDPMGSGLAAAGFPIVLGGMLGGVLISLLVVGPVRRVVALLVYGVAAGTVVTLVLQTWLGILQRDWALNAAAFGLAMAATAAVVVGFSSLLGPRGIAVGAVISVLVGNPISGAAFPYQFIAGPWGAVGQYFVPGSAATLVRSISYFPDADTSMQWLVLGAWMVGGLTLTVSGHFRSSAPVPLETGELEPEGRHATAAAAS